MKKTKPITLNTKLETEISSFAYINCKDLTDIVLPESIKSIGESAFAKCKNLKKITLPENLEYIGASAFSECENLEEIILPKSIKKIDKQLFLNCKNLKKVTLPINITKLPDECFKGCINLDIILNSNITELGNRVFEDCHKLSAFPTNVESFGENCFRNCRNILSANLNEHVESLPDGLFDGCTNLLNINSQKKLNIGKRCFRNCKSLPEIPSFVKCFNERAFENCTGIKKINVIGTKIPFACFRGCKNLTEISNQKNIYSMDAFAFAGCENLENFNIYNLHIIPAEAFSNCKNLKKVVLATGISSIESRSFYNCQNLTEINFPDTIETIKKEAFSNCKSIKSITVPANLKSFGDAAFAFMDSLEYINVSIHNKTFITPDNKILIHDMQQKIVLYACGNKDKSYSFKDYNVQYDELSHVSIRPIKTIGEFAFAGAKNLEELTVCACTQDIEATAFYGCENLKKLNVESIPLFTYPGFYIRNHGIYYISQTSKYKVFMPFEEVTFDGEIVTIFSNALEHFTNVKKLIFPKDRNFNIASCAFSNCSLLEEVIIPKGVNQIAKEAFNPKTKLIFSNGLDSKGFVELSHDNQYIGDYKLYVFDDGTYYIEQGDKITKITKQQIDEICSKSEAIRYNPILFLDFMNDLLKHNLAIKQLFNGILMSTMSLENREILFANLNKDDNFFLNVLKNSQLLEEKDQNTENLLKETQFSVVIDYIELLRKYHIDTPELHSKFFMANMDIKDFEQLINFDLKLFKKIIIDGKLLESDNIALLCDNKEDKNLSYYLTYEILQKNTLQDFIRLVKKYDIKDKYLFSKPFVATAKNPLMEDMIKVYDANIKRLLKASQTTQNNISAIQNISDLLILMKITGALEEDKITRQKAATFISEKIFEEKLPNGSFNEFRIIGDDIHRIFNFPYTYIRKEFDQEFATFFLENYQELFKEEINKSGFIQRVYLNFRQISKTCTSNKGSQRKLKVTMNKCKSYLLNVKFDGVTEENKKLAELIGKWYDSNNAWLNAQQVYNESLSAPRNIFTKVEVDNDGKKIYDMNPKHDLKEEINSNFSYHWLPKQDYDNLILGKYCNCCAHILGAGDGIMRASMILDNCQNLVIRNNLGWIIAKSTLYVNKKQGYAVFNNVESSFNYRDNESKKKIYNAFLQGSKAFIKTYNKNNPEYPITNISIGANRNTILDYLTDENNHPEITVQESLKFGEYSLDGYGYNGDWDSKQRLVLKRGSR